MSFSYWFVLITVHIAIPAVLSFIIIFYTWRFFAWIRRKFTEFRHKVDGYDKSKKRPKRRQYNRSVNKAEISDLLTNSFYLMPNTLKGERNPYEMSLEYKNHTTPISLDESLTKRGYKVYKEQGEDAFFDWLAKRVSSKRYSEMTYTSEKSLKDQVDFYTKYAFGDWGPMFSIEKDFQSLCLFLELYLIQDKGLVDWVKELPDRNRFSRGGQTTRHKININFKQ